MPNRFPYQDAKILINTICDAVENNAFESREQFYDFLKLNSKIAVQGYNEYGKIFFWNTASANLYGYREEDAIGRDLVDLIIPEELRNLVRAEILKAAKRRKISAPSSCDLLTKSGKYVTVYSGHLLFKWDDNAAFEFYCVDLELKEEEDEQDTGKLTTTP